MFALLAPLCRPAPAFGNASKSDFDDRQKINFAADALAAADFSGAAE
jgi:hypothetical protein